ncbi:discoidin domain-containing protein [Lachnoclostridium sp.]|uniref:discoidin domain-containing protein n=1 Tax=Lachnoclostridium sp. TaxID=2028282 RepID=UPI002898AC1A|nr:discoidin domain-containing protein [Lachnoclostridium sp.]
MKKYYIDIINGSDEIGDGSPKYPYKTLNAPLLNEDTTLVIKSGTYELYPTFLKKISPYTVVNIEGQGFDTIIDIVGKSDDWKAIGKNTTALIFNRLKFSNRKIILNYYGAEITTYTKLYFNNVLFFDFKRQLIDHSEPCFGSSNNAVYMNNCTSISKEFILSPNYKNEFIIKNSYGNFSTHYAYGTQPTLINSIVTTSKYELDDYYNLTNEDHKELGIGVYKGDYSWHFTNFILQMNNKFYSLQNEYFNFETEMYDPISKADILKNGLDYYSISSIKDFTEEKIISGDYSNITPIMTSNVLPTPYVISTDSQYSTSYAPWKAFVGNSTTVTDYWRSANGKIATWIQIDMGSATITNVVNLSCRNVTDLKALPKNFTLQCSNDGTKFEDIKSFINEINWTLGQRTFYLDTEVNFRYYRIQISENNGASYSAIGGIEFGYVNHKPIIIRPIDKFDNFKIIADTNNIIKLRGIKSDKELVIESGDVKISMAKEILDVTLQSEYKDTSDIRIAFSTDKGVTWFTYDGSKKVNLDCIIPMKSYSDMTVEEKVLYNIAKDTIAQNGMSVNTFNSLDFNDIKTYQIRFAYVFTRKQYNNASKLKHLGCTYNEKGFMQEMKDNEYALHVYDHKLRVITNAKQDMVKVSILT